MAQSPDALPAVTVLKQGTGAGILWCLPGSDGDPAIFGALSQWLPENFAVCGIALTAMHAHKARLSVREIATECIGAVNSRLPAGPIHLLGYSFGGLLAFEMAIQLQESGHPIGFVGMVDTGVLVELGRVTAHESAAAKAKRKSLTWLRHARTLVAGPSRMRWFRETVVSKLFAKAYALLSARSHSIPRWLRNVNDLNIFASTRYQPPPYAGRLVLIRARDEMRDSRWTLDLGWRSIPIAELEIRELPGTHRDLLRTESAVLAAVVHEYLAASAQLRR
jgi:thioesterase domain-containing protein